MGCPPPVLLLRDCWPVWPPAERCWLRPLPPFCCCCPFRKAAISSVSACAGAAGLDWGVTPFPLPAAAPDHAPPVPFPMAATGCPVNVETCTVSATLKVSSSCPSPKLRLATWALTRSVSWSCRKSWALRSS